MTTFPAIRRVLARSTALAVACALSGVIGHVDARARADGAAPIRIALRPQVEVDHTLVVLADVLDDSARKLPELQDLLSLSLGRIPADGDAVQLDRDTLARWIHIRSGLPANRIAWSGAPTSRIHRVTAMVSGERIAQLACERVRAALQRNGLRVDVAASQVPADVAVPTGALELKLREPAGAPSSVPGRTPSAAEPIPKHQSVWVDAWVDGRFVRTVPVVLEVSAYAPAYVAARDLPAGVSIDGARPASTQFAVREVDWSGRHALPMAVGSAAVAGSALPPAPATLRRAVRAGDALSGADLNPAPLVARGDLATLHAYQGAIELESRVEVLQDGGPGQLVRVRLANAAGAITARVVGPAEVEVRQ
jgi:flagellar basal body P-ring formation protein FlgA